MGQENNVFSVAFALWLNGDIKISSKFRIFKMLQFDF